MHIFACEGECFLNANSECRIRLDLSPTNIQPLVLCLLQRTVKEMSCQSSCTGFSVRKTLDI